MLRTLTSDDQWPLWRAVRQAALADASEYFPRAADDWARMGESLWRELLADPSGLKIVAVQDGEPVAVVRGARENTWAWLHSLWVSPQARGHGLGTQLVEAVENWARQWQARMLMLSVVPDNQVAIGLYERLGFVEAGLPGERLPDGRRELIMRKKLSS